MNYLAAINSVLVRLRERQVESINENEYSSLIATLINDSIQAAHMWAVDKGITGIQYFDAIVDSVNAFLDSLKALGAIVDGKCWADPELNSAANISQGKTYFNFDFTPVYPGEQITFRSMMTNEYLKEIF